MEWNFSIARVIQYAVADGYSTVVEQPKAKGITNSLPICASRQSKTHVYSFCN
jgi:hypothetical protein